MPPPGLGSEARCAGPLGPCLSVLIHARDDRTPGGWRPPYGWAGVETSIDHPPAIPLGLLYKRPNGRKEGTEGTSGLKSQKTPKD